MDPSSQKGQVSVSRLPFEIETIEYVEFYVGSAFQASHFYCSALGFQLLATAGVETGISDRLSFWVQQGEVNLLLTGASQADSPVAYHTATHGDSVKEIGFRVNDAVIAFQNAVEAGAQPVLEPVRYEDESGQWLIKAAIAAYGDTVHSFIQRSSPDKALWFPGYKTIKHRRSQRPLGINYIDHLAICLEAGTLPQWVHFYQQILGLEEFYQITLHAESGGLNSKALQNRTGTFKLTLVEPVSALQKSQLNEFLKFHRGPGVQHLALHSQDVVQTIRVMQERGVEFLQIPDSYYDTLGDRVGLLNEDLEQLKQFKILADRNEQGYLLQAFTTVVQDRPTFFLEVIQRHGAQSYGEGNFKALFQAVADEQDKRTPSKILPTSLKTAVPIALHSNSLNAVQTAP